MLNRTEILAIEDRHRASLRLVRAEAERDLARRRRLLDRIAADRTGCARLVDEVACRRAVGRSLLRSDAAEIVRRAMRDPLANLARPRTAI